MDGDRTGWAAATARRRPSRQRWRTAGGTLLVSSTLLTAVAAAAPPPLAGPQPVVGNHSTTGVITSLTATTLVLSRGGRPSLAFTLTPETFLDPGLDVGAAVSVRFRMDGDRVVATAVTRRHHAGG